MVSYFLFVALVYAGFNNGKIGWGPLYLLWLLSFCSPAHAAPISPQERFDKLEASIKVDVKLLKRVNQRINAIQYVEDRENYDVSDYWATPEEFYRLGGDCEDFVIAKIHALRGYGVPMSDMRYNIVKLPDGTAHALLSVIVNKKTYVLDNLTNEIYGPGYLASFTPASIVEVGGVKPVSKWRW